MDKAKYSKSCCNKATYLKNKAACGDVICPGACERHWAESLGITFVMFAISRRVASSEWDRIFAELKKGNCLIHCVAGTDRTGAVSGAWMLATKSPQSSGGHKNDGRLMTYIGKTGTRKTGEVWSETNPSLKKWMLGIKRGIGPDLSGWRPQGPLKKSWDR
jgi:hypothetical protein